MASTIIVFPILWMAISSFLGLFDEEDEADDDDDEDEDENDGAESLRVKRLLSTALEPMKLH